MERINALQRPGAPSVLARVIALYLDSSAELLEKIRQSVADADGESLGTSAHSLKSSSGNVGAQVLAQLCRELEGYGRKGNITAAEALMERLSEVAEATKSALREQLRFDLDH